MPRLWAAWLPPQPSGPRDDPSGAGAAWPNRPWGAGLVLALTSPGLRHLSDKDWQHIQQPSARPAPSCGHLCRASCSEQPDSRLQNAGQFPQRPSRPTAPNRFDRNQMTSTPRPSPNRTTPLFTPLQRTPSGPGPFRPGRPPQRSTLGPGSTLSRCPAQGRHPHECQA